MAVPVPFSAREIFRDGGVADPAKPVTIDDEIDAFPEPVNEPEGLRQGGPALEEQSRMPVRLPVVGRLDQCIRQATRCPASRSMAALLSGTEARSVPRCRAG